MNYTPNVVLAVIVVAIIGVTSCGAFAYHFPFHKVLPDSSQDPSSDQLTTYGQHGAKSFSQFFGTIKSMTIEFNSSADNVTSSQVISFNSRLAPMDDGMAAYMVNLTGTELTENLTDQDAVQVWLDPSTSEIMTVSMGQEQWTGESAQHEASVLNFITTDNWLSMLNSTTVAPVSVNQSVEIGSTQLMASTYLGLPSLPLYQNMKITVGTIPQTGMQLVLSSVYSIPGSGSFSFRVISLAPSQ